jgi:1-acyl-sn-glycerol-3-phosphate acyltransferase
MADKRTIARYAKFVLLFSPHTSYVDNFLLAPIQARYKFEGYWLAAEKLFKNPLMRAFLLWVAHGQWTARRVIILLNSMLISLLRVSI